MKPCKRVILLTRNEEYSKIKEMIMKEKNRIEKIYDRDIGIKFIELFDESENSVSYLMMELLNKYYKGHFPFEYHVRSFYIGTQQLFDKLSDRHIAMKELFDSLAKNYDEMVAIVADEPKKEKIEEIKEVSEERQKELIEKIKYAKTRGEQLNLIASKARRLHDVDASDQAWITKHLSENRLWLPTRGIGAKKKDNEEDNKKDNTDNK